MRGPPGKLRLFSGGWKLYVAIADVSSYVKLGSALDAEAQVRGNSVYFPERVPASDLVARDGLVVLKTDPSRSAGYGDLIGGRRFNLQLDQSAVRKHPREWSVLGTPVPRVDMRDMVMGRFEFVHNVKVPGMLHGRVVRPPEVGATVGSVDESSIRELPGIVKVVVKGNFVGVVAQKPWQAMQGADRLKVSWTRGTPLSPHTNLYLGIRKQPARDTFSWIPAMSMPGWRRRPRF